MFRCELSQHLPESQGCGSRVLPSGTPALKVPVAFRATEYPSRTKANKQRIKRKVKRFDDPGGAGYEIAKEVLSCEVCATAYSALQPSPSA
jgi:hypothetical protein